MLQSIIKSSQLSLDGFNSLTILSTSSLRDIGLCAMIFNHLQCLQTSKLIRTSIGWLEVGQSQEGTVCFEYLFQDQRRAVNFCKLFGVRNQKKNEKIYLAVLFVSVSVKLCISLFKKSNKKKQTNKQTNKNKRVILTFSLMREILHAWRV